MIISSLNNPKIKHIIHIQKKSKNRKLKYEFIIEGLKEINMALKANYKIKEIFICKNIFSQKLCFLKKKIYFITLNIFKKISYRKTTGGIIALVQEKIYYLNNIQLNKNPLILILDKLEKPGNLGAIIRSADGAGVDLIILCNPKIDIFNPNVIRSSLGAVFNIKIIIENFKNISYWLNKHKFIKIITTFMNKKSKNLYEINLKNSIAIVIGSEDKGLSNYWLNLSNDNLIIPITGKIDSLNINSASSIILFESIRQRYYNNIK